MRIVPFDQDQASTVAQWPATSIEALMWCGVREHPFEVRRVEEWQRAQDVSAFALLDAQETVGYGELWTDDEEDEIELARIIVAPSRRGAGLGQFLVQALLKEALSRGFNDVFMRVHPDNTKAIQCYLKSGFVPVADELAAGWNEPQPVAYVWLRNPRAES
ncbi:GNAT family N-acetyltransferase [Streptomyces globisporus]|uniref:GNAT family N-acetyltransferase n=1 Tax=Streptomyces globisporus TaxID=1908 RepID=UPI0037F26F40